MELCHMATFILIFFASAAGASSGKSPVNLGVYSSEQRCQMAAIQVGAMVGESKPKYICVQQ
jgi:hypothetical protein